MLTRTEYSNMILKELSDNRCFAEVDLDRRVKKIFSTIEKKLLIMICQLEDAGNHTFSIEHNQFTPNK